MLKWFSDWNKLNPILADGEIGEIIGMLITKTGDGKTRWRELSYTQNVVVGSDFVLSEDGETFTWNGLPVTLGSTVDTSLLQPSDSDLTAIATLTTTAYGLALLELIDATAGRTVLELGTAATAASGDFQPVDTDLTAISALTTTAYGRSFLALVDSAGGRTLLELGALAVKSTIVVPSDIAATGIPGVTTFLRGDGSWSTPAAGSVVTLDTDGTLVVDGVIVEVATDGELATEATTRASADTALDGRLDTLESVAGASGDIFNGVGLPPAGAGLAGDYYHSTDLKQLYGPKGSDTDWGVDAAPIFRATSKRIGSGLLTMPVGTVVGDLLLLMAIAGYNWPATPPGVTWMERANTDVYPVYAKSYTKVATQTDIDNGVTFAAVGNDGYSYYQIFDFYSTGGATPRAEAVASGVTGTAIALDVANLATPANTLVVYAEVNNGANTVRAVPVTFTSIGSEGNGGLSTSSRTVFKAFNGVDVPNVIFDTGNAWGVHGLVIEPALVTSFVDLSDREVTQAELDTAVANKVTTDTTQTITGAKDFTGALTKTGVSVVVTSDVRLADTRVPTDASVTTAKLGDGQVTAAKVAADVATQAELDSVSNALDGRVDTLEAALGPVGFLFFSDEGILVSVVGAVRIYNDSDVSRTLLGVRASLITAGSTNTIIDVHKDGVTVFTTQTARPTLTTGLTTITATPTVTVWAAGSYLTVDVDAAGTSAADLIVQVSYR